MPALSWCTGFVAKRHPRADGALRTPGENGSMSTTADVMTTDVITVTPETPIRDIESRLYTRRISGVLVA